MMQAVRLALITTTLFAQSEPYLLISIPARTGSSRACQISLDNHSKSDTFRLVLSA